MPFRATTRAASLVLALAAMLTACGGSDDEGGGGGGATTDGDTVAITITRKDDTFTPNGERVEMKVGQTLALTVDSDAAGELHVHSTPEQEIAYDAGTSEHDITIDRPGVVEVESHDLEKVILQLEVQ